MGSYVAGQIMETVGKKQKEIGMRMRKKQIQNMMAAKIAFTREFVRWYGGFYGFFALGACMYAVKHKRFPKVAVFPLAAMGTILAYQLDLAYGNKVNRLYSIKLAVMEDPKYFFNPNYVGDLPAIGETVPRAKKPKEEQL